jgi:glycosyltransferase involved in cell wall biosynthesis
MRKLDLLRRHVAFFVPPSAFVRRRLVEAGFPEDRMRVLPNIAASLPDVTADGPSERREYVAFVGRISPEKGIATLLTSARETGLPVRLAGELGADRDLIAGAPANVTFLGRLPRDALVRFFQGARFLVAPSIWYEPHALTIVEAMSQGLPVIGSRIGGIPEAVDDGVTGLLVEPGNATDLSDKMLRLWRDPPLCERMGRVARERARREYSEAVYYRRLIEIYEAAAAGAPAGATPTAPERASTSSE